MKQRPAANPRQSPTLQADSYVLSQDAHDKGRDFTHSAYADIRRAWRLYVQPQWRMLIFAILAMLGTAASFWALPHLIEAIVDKMLVAKNLDAMPMVIAGIIAVFSLRAVSIFFQRGLMATISLRALGRLREDLAACALKLDYGFFNKNSPGELISRQTTDTVRLKSVVEGTVLGLARDVPTLIGLFVFLLYKDWIWTLSALLALPLIGAPVIITSRYIRSYARRAAGLEAQVTTAYDEAFHGIRALKTNQAEALETQRFFTRIRLYVRTAVKEAWVMASMPSIVEIVAMIGMIFVIWFGGKQVIAGTKSSGELVAYLSSLIMLYDPLKRVVSINAQIQTISASLTRVFEILDQKPRVVDAANAKNMDPHTCKGAIEFDQVSFAYEPNELLLENLSFKIEPGQKVALVGASGSGKSSTLLLIPRLFDLDQGRILIDGQDIAQVTQHSLRANMAYVGQEPTLFDDTVRTNLTLGNPEADETDIKAATRAAQALGFIQDLPQGLDTPVGPRGERLSGGQRQRLVIARALLRAGPILLLDEATAALDSETEQAVQNALDKLSGRTTCLVVAHRLSTVVNADLILVFDQGKVVESGNHQYLLQNGRVYPNLVQAQLSSSTKAS